MWRYCDNMADVFHAGGSDGYLESWNGVSDVPVARVVVYAGPIQRGESGHIFGGRPLSAAASMEGGFRFLAATELPPTRSAAPRRLL